MMNLPILYSLQNCPYAMRARLAIYKSKRCVRIRAVKLNNKPAEMLLASPKGSVPVLVVIDNALILEESLEIMLWALSHSDPLDLLHGETPLALPHMIKLIAEFEQAFIPAFNLYSSAKRYHEDNVVEKREKCEFYVQQLEVRLSQHKFLFSDKESLLDIALMPFLRKFARIERQWYLQSPYPLVRQWLNHYLQSKTFSKVMEKHELWVENRADIVFGEID
jgi:glutathione S-transferase